MPQYILAGTIKKAKGLNGEVRVRFEKEALFKVKNIRALFINMTTASYLPFMIEKMDVNEGGEAVIKFAGIETVEQATQLAGKNVYAEEKLLKIKKGVKERAWETLKGYMLFDNDTEIGRIDEVYSMPGQYIAEIQYKGTDVLVPLKMELIKDIDDNKRHITMHLPDGLLDIYTDKNTDSDED